jgi:hypothetical protein
MASSSALPKAFGTVLVTSDQHMKYQQNLSGRKISILVMRAKSNRLPHLLPLLPACLGALEQIQPGQVTEVGIR